MLKSSNSPHFCTLFPYRFIIVPDSIRNIRFNCVHPLQGKNRDKFHIWMQISPINQNFQNRNKADNEKKIRSFSLFLGRVTILSKNSENRKAFSNWRSKRMRGEDGQGIQLVEGLLLQFTVRKLKFLIWGSSGIHNGDWYKDIKYQILSNLIKHRDSETYLVKYGANEQARTPQELPVHAPRCFIRIKPKQKGKQWH